MTKSISHYHARELETGFKFSQAARVGNTLYISGHLSWDENGDIVGVGDMGAQVQNIYRELQRTLEAHGASFASVVKENVFTTDMAALVAVADQRAQFFAGLDGPASTWVEVKRLVPDDALLEVEMIAVVE